MRKFFNNFWFSVAVCAAVSVCALRGQDDPRLINVFSLEQLNAMRYDLNGDGAVDGGVSEANAMVYEAAFGLAREGSVVCVGGCDGYELINDLDFEDANTDGTAGDLSIWAAGADGAGVSGAVVEGWVPIGTSAAPIPLHLRGMGT